MKSFHFMIVLLFATACLSQDKAPNPSYEKSVEWVDIHVSKYPYLAITARMSGTVAIEVRFKGCELDPASPRIVSGPSLLTEAALQSLKQSTIRCGDFPDSTTTLYYEFVLFDNYSQCNNEYPRMEVIGSHVRIFQTPGRVMSSK